MTDVVNPFEARSASLADRRDGERPSTNGEWKTQLASSAPDAVFASARGSFAVAVTNESGRTILATDRFATRALYYRIDGSRVLVSGRADELAVDKTDLEPQALFDYLYFHIIPSPRTIFRGVYQLPAGHFATFESGTLRVQPYWIPQFDEPQHFDLAWAKAEFKRLLLQAVRRRVETSGNTACYLSGGTDSSTIAGMIGLASGTPAAAYSIGFDAEGYDEMRYARIAAKHFGCTHREYYVTPDDVVQTIPEIARAYDQPFGNASAVPAYHCALRAHEDGHSRILAGDGGDELFGGNTRYATQEIFAWYDRVPMFVRSRLLEPFFGNGMIGKTPLLRKGTGYIRRAKTPMPHRLQAFNLLRRLGYPEVLTPELLAQITPTDPETQQEAVWSMARCGSELNRHLAFDWRYTLADNDLPKIRGTARLAGISAAYPRLDDELVEFSMKLPDSYKVNRLRLRWFFKEALRDFLPDEILRKKKQGFGLPFGVWAMRHDRLHRLAVDALRSIAGRGIVRTEFVDRLIAESLPSHPHYYGSMVWVLTMLEHWLQAHAPNYKL